MSEVMYHHNSVLIVAILLVSLVLAIEVGYRVGLRLQGLVSESTKSQINAIQASLLGVLALLLGFTFSLSLQRFDSRSEAVVDEANAIGTTYLRTHLLPSSLRGGSQGLLREYLELRVRAGTISLDKKEDREALFVKSNQYLDALWHYARRAAEEDGGPVTSGLFIQSLNELIDSFGTRDAALNRHVPELVLLLLFITFLLSAALVGYGSGLCGHRASSATYVLATLIALLAFMVIDLDRPRRGFIEVPQEPMRNLQATIEATKEMDGKIVR